VGARLDLRQTGTEVNSFARKAQVVWVDIDQTELDEPRVKVWKSIRSDAGVFVSSLLQVLMTTNLVNRDLIGTDTEWQDRIRTAKELRVDDDPKSFPTGTLHPRDILDEVTRQIGDTSLTVVTGVGLHQQWAARHLPTSPAKVSFLTSSGHGTMGFDLPAAIGAALVAPNCRVLCVVGDGSLMMNIQELAALSERALDVKILLMNNQRLGIVSQFQLIRWGDDPSTGVFLGPDFSQVAEGFGIPARTLESKTDIEASIEWLWQQQGPALLDARMSHDVDVVPMLLAGQTMGEMWMGHA
jgi:acetolactate synthase-1/2/3 large subunit